MKTDRLPKDSTVTAKAPRIEVVDALRGLAIMAIALLHNIEHFNLYYFPPTNSELLKTLDTSIWDSLFFLFGGKAYAIFALLFGFSYYIQFSNQQRKGNDFCYRFLWRLLLLFGFGIINAAFFPGDILTLYAIIGIVLIPIRKLSNKVVFCFALFLLLQPVEWGKIIYAYLNPAYTLPKDDGSLWTWMQTSLMGNSFIEALKFNLTGGEWFTLKWAWDNGRFCQTAALFFFGLILGRKQLFIYSEKSIIFWKKACAVAASLFVIFFIMKSQLIEAELRNEILIPLKLIISSWSNATFMLLLVSLFILLWYKSKVNHLFSKLIPYGKMSLTNYVFMGILGSILYFGYGFGLYKYLGTTFSFLLGIVMLIAQLLFSRWWLAHHRQGPLERIWHKLTWMGMK